MKHKRHRWIVICDCSEHYAEEERDCCCIGGSVCLQRPVKVCRCGARKAA